MIFDTYKFSIFVRQFLKFSSSTRRGGGVEQHRDDFVFKLPRTLRKLMIFFTMSTLLKFGTTLKKTYFTFYTI